MECPGPSGPKILSPENYSLVSGKALDGRDGLLGCLPAGVAAPYLGVLYIENRSYCNGLHSIKLSCSNAGHRNLVTGVDEHKSD